MFLMETIRPEAPKSPVNNGRRGSLIGKFKVKNPRKPAKRKIVKDRRNSFSENIRYREIKISK